MKTETQNIKNIKVNKSVYTAVIQSVIIIHIRPPIRKVLVSINQSSSDNLIYFSFKFFNRPKEESMYKRKSGKLPSQILPIFLLISFSKKITFSLKKKTTPPKILFKLTKN